MKFSLWLCVGVVVTISMVLPASGCLVVQGQEPVKLPQCAGETATRVLNRALRDADQSEPLRIEAIDDGRQTNFALHGSRECVGSMTALDGLRYTGVWTYTRIGDNEIEVKFSLQPAK